MTPRFAQKADLVTLPSGEAISIEALLAERAQIIDAARAVRRGRDATIADLRAQLSAEQDKRSDTIRERNEAIEEARNATAANQILKAEVPRLEGEIARLAACSAPTAAEIANVIRCAFAGDRHIHDFDLAAQAVLALLARREAP